MEMAQNMETNAESEILTHWRKVKREMRREMNWKQVQRETLGDMDS